LNQKTVAPTTLPPATLASATVRIPGTLTLRTTGLAVGSLDESQTTNLVQAAYATLFAIVCSDLNGAQSCNVNILDINEAQGAYDIVYEAVIVISCSASDCSDAKSFTEGVYEESSSHLQAAASDGSLVSNLVANMLEPIAASLFAGASATVAIQAMEVTTTAQQLEVTMEEAFYELVMCQCRPTFPVSLFNSMDVDGDQLVNLDEFMTLFGSKQCVFPFKLVVNGTVETYNECTVDEDPFGFAWCATRTLDNGFYDTGFKKYCDENSTEVLWDIALGILDQNSDTQLSVDEVDMFTPVSNWPYRNMIIPISLLHLILNHLISFFQPTSLLLQLLHLNLLLKKKLS
jgi:hypothetical protein